MATPTLVGAHSQSAAFYPSPYSVDYGPGGGSGDQITVPPDDAGVPGRTPYVPVVGDLVIASAFIDASLTASFSGLTAVDNGSAHGMRWYRWETVLASADYGFVFQTSGTPAAYDASFGIQVWRDVDGWAYGAPDVVASGDPTAPQVGTALDVTQPHSSAWPDPSIGFQVQLDGSGGEEKDAAVFGAVFGGSWGSVPGGWTLEHGSTFQVLSQSVATPNDPGWLLGLRFGST